MLKISAVCLTLFHLASCGPTQEELNKRKVYRQKIEAGLRTTDEKAKEAAAIHGRLTPSQVTSRIRERLRDPKAAMFKNVKRIGLVTVVPCSSTFELLGFGSDVGDLWKVSVNGKNGYGAYTGYQTGYYLDRIAITDPSVGTYIFKKRDYTLKKVFVSSDNLIYHD